MKHFLLCLLLSIVYVGASVSAVAQDKFQPKYIREDNKAFKALTTNVSVDGWIEFRQDNLKINPGTFFDLYGSAIGLDKSYRTKLVKDKADVKENRHQRYQLFYKGIPVEGADYTLHSRAGTLKLAHGRIPDGLAIDVDKAMLESKALSTALTEQKLTLESFMAQKKLPKGELVITSINDDMSASNMALAYAFDLNLFRVYVDATTGKIIKKQPLVFPAWATNTAILIRTQRKIQNYRQGYLPEQRLICFWVEPSRT